MKHSWRRLVLLLVPIASLVACVATAGCAHRPSTAYYLTEPVRAESITVYFDERTMIWMDAWMREARYNLQEDAACLHVARSEGDTTFWVDSLERAAYLPMYGAPAAASATWAHVRALCPPETAPLHWHVVTPAFHDVLAEVANDSSGFIIRHRCELSPSDVARPLERYPFVAMQCGTGRDSVVVRRIRRHQDR